MSKRVALYCGSFAPFHQGHLYVLSTAADMFDKVVLCVASNPLKKYRYDASVRARMITDLLKEFHLDNVEVIGDSGMLIDVAKKYGAHFLVKGVRNSVDFENEIVQADANMHLGNLKTVFIPSPPHLRFLSSSLINQLESVRGSEGYLRKLTLES